MQRRLFLHALTLLPLVACAPAASTDMTASKGPTLPRRFKVEKSDAEWRKILNAQQYDVLRQQGTERAFSGALWNEHRPGTYRCAGCNTPLFSSTTKFESGTGWPSYYQPLDDKAVLEIKDVSLGMVRVEVQCATCGGHLGHVFDDGPKPTGLRYCMNSAALTFEPTPT